MLAQKDIIELTVFPEHFVESVLAGIGIIFFGLFVELKVLSDHN